jgi:hypothetical protein
MDYKDPVGTLVVACGVVVPGKARLGMSLRRSDNRWLENVHPEPYQQFLVRQNIRLMAQHAPMTFTSCCDPSSLQDANIQA